MDILKLNAWLRVYAEKTSALVDDKGMLKEGFSRDGLQPNDKGYELIAPVAAAAIQQDARQIDV